MTDKILDCHHNDITQIVSERHIWRLARKLIHMRRYVRRYARHQ